MSFSIKDPNNGVSILDKTNEVWPKCCGVCACAPNTLNGGEFPVDGKTTRIDFALSEANTSREECKQRWETEPFYCIHRNASDDESVCDPSFTGGPYKICPGWYARHGKK